MIAHIYINNHHFSMFYMKKKNKIIWGLHTHVLTRALPWTPWRLLAHPIPHLQLFLALPKTNAPIFFMYYPQVFHKALVKILAHTIYTYLFFIIFTPLLLQNKKLI